MVKNFIQYIGGKIDSSQIFYDRTQNKRFWGCSAGLYSKGPWNVGQFQEIRTTKSLDG